MLPTICISASQHPDGVTKQEEEAFLILFLVFPQLYTLQRKLRKRERAKAQSSRKKDKGRTKPRHRSRDKQSPGMPAKKKGQRQQWERSSSRRRHQICNQAGPQAPPIPVDL